MSSSPHISVGHAHVSPQKRRKTTMRDVVERARVSVQTVSNVVNGRFNLMGSDTRERVEEAMAILDYRPNATARGLRSARTHEIGFLVVDDEAKFLADPMNGAVMAGSGEVAAERGYGLLIESARMGEIDDGLFTPLLENRIDGAILFLSGSPKQREVYLERMLELGFPCVLFGESRDGEFPSVTATNSEGAARMTKHLLDAGHRRIAFIAGEAPWPMIEQRYAGYRSALREAGVDPERKLQLFRGRFEPTAGEVMASRLLELKDPPSAIVAANDVLALGAFRAARARGLGIPDDIAITGFNDFDFAAFLDPPLTTVHVPMYEMGQAASDMLMNELEGRGKASSREFAVELLIRQSS